MKKLIAICLALIMIVSGLVACNKSEDESNITEPVITTTADPAVTTDPSGGKEEKPVSSKSPNKIIEEIAPGAQLMMSTTLCREILLKDISKDTVLKAFTDEDFEVVKTTPIEGAKFETIVLSRKFDVITLYWSKAKNEIRVSLEKTIKDGLYMLSPNAETGKGSISVAQIGIERSGEADNPLNGMCYIIKLSSGKAIIIDGGFNTDICADNIYNSLAKMGISQKAGKYEIEAWILTHGHSDHIGAIKKFSSKYASNAQVAHIVSAFPGSPELIDGYNDQLSSSVFSSARRINPHAGIKYYFGNVAISMFYTPDMIYVPNGKIAYYNDSSLVFRVEGGGADAFFFGDAGEVVSTELLASYELSAFKSDIVQITHHALYTESNGHTWTELKKVYDAIDADYAFLPMHSRYGTTGRNGRFTVMVEWARYGYQSSYVVNENDNHGLSSITQQYYDSFTESVAAGTNTKATLFGYNGINKVVNENGLITYLGGNESAPMVTLFEFSDGKATLKTNETLCVWLGATAY